MATDSSSNKAWLIAALATGEATHDNFALVDVPMPGPPAAGAVTVKALYISVDPYMRGRLQERPADAPKSYIGAFEAGKPGSGGIIGEVTATASPDFAVGDLVSVMAGWVLHQNVETSPQMVKLPAGVPPSWFLGSLGLTGLTAKLSIDHIAAPKAGETAFVNAGAGAVGSVACQLLKAAGLRVISCAGTDEKVEWLKTELGVDAAWNRKTTPIKEALKEHAPDGLDVFFDNVGGEQLDAALVSMNRFGRIVACGSISGYQTPEAERYGVKNLFNIIGKSLKFEGFIVTQWVSEFPAAAAELGALAQAGKISTRETVIDNCFSGTALPDAFIGLFTGHNIGKMVVKV